MHKPLSVLRADETTAANANGGLFGETEEGGRAVAPPPFRKRDIPTPIIATVSAYEAEQSGDFRVPDGYIRFPRRTAGEDDVATCEYCLEVEDEEWLEKHPRYGSSAVAAAAAAAPSEKAKERLLDEDKLELMLGILEMSTGQADPIPLPQAETLFVSKLGMSKAVHHDAWTEVYRYWKDKRSRLGKPLLRRFWPVTPSNDTDPHKVFRPREKERYKLRKHRKNDLDSFRKLQQVKKDFEKLLSITRMIQKREMMKREQLMVQQEIFLQQHWDLTDTTGESRPLGIEPGKYKARPRQPAAAAASAAAAAGGAVGAGAVPAGAPATAAAAPAAVQTFEKARDERDRSSSRKSKKRKDRERDRVSRASGGGGDGGLDDHYGDEDDDGDEYGAAGSGAGGASVGEDGVAGGSSGVIPGSYITVLPSFMDDLKTRANMPVRTVVEPALAVYTSFGGGGAKGKSGGGVGSGGGGSRERERGGGGARGKARVGIEPVYKFRLRGRIGRGGRVMWDRVPVKGALPARDDGLADPEEAPLVVHSSYVQFPFKPPSAHVLHPPMVNLNADERRYREICAMDDDQDELLEPLGLGLTLDSSAPSAAAAAAGGGDSRGSSSSSSAATKIKYAIEV